MTSTVHSDMPNRWAVPTRADITPAWLTGILRERGHLRESKVSSINFTAFGTGQSADTFRIEIDETAALAAGFSTLVAKFPSENSSSRAMGIKTGMYEREAAFYSTLAPQLTLRLPVVAFSAFDRATSDFAILLEDLAPARQGNQLVGCSIEEAARVIEQVAALHADSWHDLAMATTPWLASGIRSIRETSKHLDVFQSRFRREFADVIDTGDLAITDELLGQTATWQRFVESPTCLWHRDFRADNVLFPDGNDAMQPCILDWQTVTMGPGICDVSQFLGGSLTVEDRRNHEVDLVKIYHARLKQGGVSDYSFDQCWEDYRVGSLHSLFTLMHAPVRVKRTARGDELWAHWAHHHCTQVRDLDAIGALSNYRHQ